MCTNMTPGGDRNNCFILVRKAAAQLRTMTNKLQKDCEYHAHVSVIFTIYLTSYFISCFVFKFHTKVFK